jgi:Rps23 Pro-64 3,4-dihydroxylase Tpa1-like proline 4-hydroxylase
MATNPAPKFTVIDGFLSPALHSGLLAYALASEAKFKPASVLRSEAGEVDTRLRQSLRCEEGLGPFKDTFAAAVHARLPLLFESTGVQPFAVAETELELAAHGHAGFYKMHLDTFTHGARQAAQSDRMISAVYYFNRTPKGFSGGDLQLYRFGGGPADRIEPQDNRLLAFPSFAPHEVLPIDCPSGRFEDYRFAINCWLHRARGQ